MGELVRHALTEILQRGVVADPVLERAVLTVTEVAMSPDLKTATVFVAPTAGGDGEAVVDALNRHGKYIRGQLSPALRQMKFMPQLRFRVDTSLDNFEKIDRLLRSPKVRQDLDGEPRDDDGGEG